MFLWYFCSVCFNQVKSSILMFANIISFLDVSTFGDRIGFLFSCLAFFLPHSPVLDCSHYLWCLRWLFLLVQKERMDDSKKHIFQWTSLLILIWIFQSAYCNYINQEKQMSSLQLTRKSELNFFLGEYFIIPTFLFPFCREILLKVWLDIPLYATFCRYDSPHVHKNPPLGPKKKKEKKIMTLIWDLVRMAFATRDELYRDFGYWHGSCLEWQPQNK